MEAPFGVLRCSRCNCRVASESEVRSVEQRKDLSIAQETIAHVDRVFNIEVRNGRAVCRRCGQRHFPYQSQGETESFPSRDAALPLALNGKVVFKQSKLKVLMFVEAEPELFYRLEAAEVDGELGQKPVVIEDSAGIRALNYLCKLGKKLLPDADVSQRNVARVADNLVRPGMSERVKEYIDYADMDCSQAFEWYDTGDVEELQADGVFQDTYDVAVYVKVENNRFMYWTDFAAVGTEEILVLSWLAAGGNVLFGQWGLPSDADGKWGEELDMDHVIQEQREGELDERQDSLASLIEEGHFLGWWPLEEEPPENVLQQVKSALGCRSFPNWLFKDEFPTYTFEHTERQYGAKTATLGFQDPFHYVHHPEPKGPVMLLLEGLMDSARQLVQGLKS